MQNLEFRNVEINEKSAENLLKNYYSQLNNLTTIPVEIFKDNTFLETDEYVDLLCQIISS